MQLKYNLNWPKFTDHLQEMMHKMMKSEDFTDVTLVCDDMKQIKTHINILSACSPIFRNLLNINIPHGHPVIYLRGIPYEDMEAILHFVYLGEAKVAPDRMNQFMLSAKSLEIKELSSLEHEEGLKQTKITQNIDNQAVNVNINEIEEKAKSLELKVRELCSLENEGGLKKAKISQQKIYDEIQSDKEQNLDNEAININVSEDKGENKPVNKNWVSHQCPKCVLKFMDVSRLEEHISEKHNSSASICEHCSRKFKNPSILRQHEQSIHEGIRHSCPHCDKKFTQRSALTTHIKASHEGMRYTCDQCGAKVSTRSSLRIHIESIHQGVKYDCNLCDQKFCRKKSIEIHRLAVHEGMRFLCDQCDYQASQKGDLLAHIKHKKCSTWRRRGSKKFNESNDNTEKAKSIID